MSFVSVMRSKTSRRSVLRDDPQSVETWIPAILQLLLFLVAHRESIMSRAARRGAEASLDSISDPVDDVHLIGLFHVKHHDRSRCSSRFASRRALLWIWISPKDFPSIFRLR